MPFSPEETSVAEIQIAIRENRVTSQELVGMYLDRINSYDKIGPRINSIIVVNPDATQAAGKLDRVFSKTGRLIGPLHGVPVIVKDNIDIDGLPTTAGSLALAGSRPRDDAFVVQRLRRAGAIILAKANLHEFASSSFETVSSILPGYTRNPYDLNRTTAGSSGGTAAAIAANLGAVGIGTDTGNSIRGPASHQALVGLRATVGLVSRDGLVPLDPSRDVIGPMTRTVADAAVVMDAIAGEDPSDPSTLRCRGHLPVMGYISHLKLDGLRGARIGVLRQLSNTPTSDADVLSLFDDAIGVMQDRGAELVDPAVISDIDELARRPPFECRPFREALRSYLADLGPNAPARSLAEIIDSGLFHPSVESRLRLYLSAERPHDNPVCHAARHREEKLRNAIQALMTDNELHVLVYPSWNNPPRLVGDLNSPNGNNGPRISSVIGVPAITVPMGFVGGGTLPVGLEILGLEWSEPRLIEIAYSFERATAHRRPPPAMPPLQVQKRLPGGPELFRSVCQSQRESLAAEAPRIQGGHR